MKLDKNLHLQLIHKIFEMTETEKTKLLISLCVENQDLLAEMTEISDVNFKSAKNDAWKNELKSGNKIGSIKEYRATHGVDLLSAKNAVEAYQQKMGW